MQFLWWFQMAKESNLPWIIYSLVVCKQEFYQLQIRKKSTFMSINSNELELRFIIFIFMQHNKSFVCLFASK